MNAYELADKLETDKWDEATIVLSIDAGIKMLRQQADRIAALEKLLEHSIGSDCREMRYIQEIENKDARIEKLEKWEERWSKRCQRQQDRIAELEKDGKVCATCGGLVYDAVLPQTKPLSEEEIDNICQEIACECQHIETDEWIYRIVARAIEERHGIK